MYEISACKHVCTHVCMHACMHVCMYACMHVISLPGRACCRWARRLHPACHLRPWRPYLLQQAWQDRAGQDRTRQDSTGQGRARQDRAAQARPCRTDQHRQTESGQDGTEREVQDQTPETDRHRANRQVAATYLLDQKNIRKSGRAISPT